MILEIWKLAKINIRRREKVTRRFLNEAIYINTSSLVDEPKSQNRCKETESIWLIPDVI